MMNVFIPYVLLLLAAFNVQASGWKEARIEVQTLFNKALSEDDIYNASWAIYSPSKKIDWHFSGGQFSSGEKVSGANPFYTASIGKTFTATAIAMLNERGDLKLTDKITKYLPQEVVSGLHVFEGQDYSTEITIEQLLQHTSGLPDYFGDETYDHLPNATALLFAAKDRLWTPVELLNISKKSMRPHFEPGTSYRYSENGYVLLGLIIEQVSGLGLHDFFQQHIFAPLNMNNTYMHLRAKPRLATKKMSEIYVQSTEISTFKSLSLDWAGGGLVSTARDLNRFQMALHTFQLVTAETLKKMQQWIPESKGLYYGFGLRKVSSEERFSSDFNLNMIGHTGSTSSFMFYCPDQDIYLSGTFNQINQVQKSITVPFTILTYLQGYESNEK